MFLTSPYIDQAITRFDPGTGILSFTWTCGPPIGMKARCQCSLIPNGYPVTFDGVMGITFR